MTKLLLSASVALAMLHTLAREKPGRSTVTVPVTNTVMRPHEDTTGARFVGDWTMIDPHEAGYPTSFEEAQEMDALPVIAVYYRFNADRSMMRMVDIAWGRTDTSHGRWSVRNDTLAIAYPGMEFAGIGSFRLRGDTLYLTRLPMKEFGNTVRLLRGIWSEAELNPEVIVDDYATIDFSYPPALRPKRHTDFRMLFDRKPMPEIGRIEKRLGGKRLVESATVLNEYLYPYMRSYTMADPIEFDRPSASGQVYRSFYLLSLPDSSLKGIFYEIEGIGFEDPPAEAGRLNNALFDRIVDYMGDNLGTPDSLDAAPTSEFSEGRTYWSRTAYWNDGRREAHLSMGIGEYARSIRMRIYWK